MAAGLGFKTFTTGEVLTAADVNGYLMQGVLVFANATARDAAITSPQEGQFAYLKDTNVTTYYTGSAWANLDTTGMTNPMTTTGDTIYSSSGSTPARLGIGTAGQVLTVNSGATAPEWATPSSGGMTQISTGTLSGAQVDITSIPGTYIHLQLIITNLLPASDGSVPKMRINANTGSVYFDGPFGGFGGAYTAASSVGLTNNGYDNVSANGLIIGNFYNYAGNTWKFWDFMTLNNDETTATSFDFRNQGGTTNQTAAITQINLFMSSGNFTSGTWTLYGVK